MNIPNQSKPFIITNISLIIVFALFLFGLWGITKIRAFSKKNRFFFLLVFEGLMITYLYNLSVDAEIITALKNLALLSFLPILGMVIDETKGKSFAPFKAPGKVGFLYMMIMFFPSGLNSIIVKNIIFLNILFAVILLMMFFNTFYGVIYFLIKNDRAVALVTFFSQIVYSILLFSRYYLHFGIINSSGELMKGTKESIYFSMVTTTTLGYGDFKPSEEIMIWAALQGFVGYIFLAFLIYILTSDKKEIVKKFVSMYYQDDLA